MVSRYFDRRAKRFDDTDFVYRRVAAELLSRTELLSGKPEKIIDLGSATGNASGILAKRFKHARIIAVDISQAMLTNARRKHTRFSRRHEVRANASCLPFADNTVDLVFSNLFLPWLDQPGAILDEAARILSRDGAFFFSTLGPDTFKELQHAKSSLDIAATRNFADMHVVGDALIHAGLRDPVLDVDRLTVRYNSADRLWQDLRSCGVAGPGDGSDQGLRGRRARSALQAAYPRDDDGLLPVTLEIVYGHGWGGGGRPRDLGGEVRVDIGDIGKSRR